MSPKIQRNVLLGTVFITGMAVLILEVLAIRLLSPQFGTSMFVLSSVLTVVLAALALGYYWGGRLADRFPSPYPLYTIIAIGGCTIAFSYGLSTVLVPLAGSILPITAGPLVLAIILFFVPAFLLGTDSPYVIKLLTTEAPSDTAGATTGTVFFWSTIGSIVGSLSAGFFFIPFVGLAYTLLGVACVLAVGAATAATLLRTPDTTPSVRPVWFIAAATVLLSALIIAAPSPHRTGSNQSTLYEADHRYGHIHIYEQTFSLTRPPARFLKREVNSESAIFQDSYEHPFFYARFADLFPAFTSTTSGHFLLLGGGAYSIARSVLGNHEDMTVSVAELEPALFPLAVKYFDLTHLDRLHSYAQDARVFIQNTNEQFDVIFMDTFSSGLYIPAHLTTVEFFTKLRSRLAPGGVLMINFIGTEEQPGMNLTDSFTKTLRSVFPNARAFSEFPKPTGRLKNMVFIATLSDDTPPPIATLTVPASTGDTQIPLRDLELPLIAKDPATQVIFTDNRSPAEYLVAKQIAATR
jgi:spermidine synthase